MSMNLYFLVNNKFYVDFPYQTRTDLTYAAIREPTKEKQLEIIFKDIDSYEWDEERKNEIKEEISTTLNDPNVKLDYL